MRCFEDYRQLIHEFSDVSGVVQYHEVVEDSDDRSGEAVGEAVRLLARRQVLLSPHRQSARRAEHHHHHVVEDHGGSVQLHEGVGVVHLLDPEFRAASDEPEPVVLLQQLGGRCLLVIWGSRWWARLFKPLHYWNKM